MTRISGHIHNVTAIRCVARQRPGSLDLNYTWIDVICSCMCKR